MNLCIRCITRQVTHDPCCLSHGKHLCCECYRRTHFVEVGNCCGVWAERSDTCNVCGIAIQAMAFKGTGACCELHRKALAGER